MLEINSTAEDNLLHNRSRLNEKRAFTNRFVNEGFFSTTTVYLYSDSCSFV